MNRGANSKLRLTAWQVLALSILWLAAPLTGAVQDTTGLELGRIRLPQGFRIEVYARVPGARSLALAPSGVLYVGTRGEGRVFAVLDSDRDKRADRVLTLAQGLNQPNGVAFRGGSLYVAEVSRVTRFDSIETRLENPPGPVVVKGDFPSDRSHGWKFIRFGPDGRLYVPVGAPCNICDPEDTYASITRMSADGSGWEVFARGIRNTVGFDWQPGSGALWFTDNGRDNLGDDVPPDELNRALRAGLHFGYPYCHAGEIADPEFGKLHPCADFVPPARKLGPHVAALGMRFYTGRMFPEQFRGQILIPEHGSWNRSQRIGYRISLVRVDGERALSYETFAEGWLRPDGTVWGRPVDLEVMPDGSLLVSDDHSGTIYRISYDGERQP